MWVFTHIHIFLSSTHNESLNASIRETFSKVTVLYSLKSFKKDRKYSRLKETKITKQLTTTHDPVLVIKGIIQVLGNICMKTLDSMLVMQQCQFPDLMIIQ